MKKLSIIVPCYNVENFIDRCLSSLTGQTLSKECYEIILVDDASTDRTWQHINEWEKKYPDLILAVHCDENGKMGRARNIGLSYATGEYVGFTDSDDWVEPEMFAALLAEAEKNKEDVVSCGHIRDYGSNGNMLTGRGNGKICRLAIATEEQRKRFIMDSPMRFNVWDKIVRKEILDRNEICFPEQVAYEDIYFSALLHMYVQKVAHIDMVYYHYYVNPDSTVLKKNVAYHYDIMTVNEKLWKTLKARGLWDRYKEALEIDMLFIWYLATLKIICLRFESPPYDMFCRLKKMTLLYMPDCLKNAYIPVYMKEFYQLLLKLLEMQISPEVLSQIAEMYRQYVQIDKV